MPTIIVITTGSQGKNPDVPNVPDRQFAHQFDANDPADRAHQAANFMRYAEALGDHVAPIVLLGGPMPDDPAEANFHKVDLDGWKSIVQTATGMAVEIR